MRTIVVGDIHGCYNELKSLILSLIENKEYNKDTDKLVFLGDYIDRGEDSRSVIRFIRDLQKDNNNVIALSGNHEDILVDFWTNKQNQNWLYNGCNATIDSYRDYVMEFEDDIEWMKTLPLYHEDDYFVYVHAGVNVNKPMDEQSIRDLLWIRENFIYNFRKYHKKVVFGHTPTMHLTGKHKPVYTEADNIAIDTGCVFGGALTALIIEDDKVVKYYQVDREIDDEQKYSD